MENGGQKVVRDIFFFAEKETHNGKKVVNNKTFLQKKPNRTQAIPLYT